MENDFGIFVRLHSQEIVGLAMRRKQREHVHEVGGRRNSDAVFAREQPRVPIVSKGLINGAVSQYIVLHGLYLPGPPILLVEFQANAEYLPRMSDHENPVESGGECNHALSFRYFNLYRPEPDASPCKDSSFRYLIRRLYFVLFK